MTEQRKKCDSIGFKFRIAKKYSVPPPVPIVNFTPNSVYAANNKKQNK